MKVSPRLAPVKRPESLNFSGHRRQRLRRRSWPCYASRALTRRLKDSPGRGEPISIRLEGSPVRAFDGESVAVALLASGHKVLSRSLKYHRPRAFFCLDGHCGGCLMRINGVPNVRACLEPCRPDTEVEGQNAMPSPDFDLLEAVDWLFPRGMKHHTMMTGSKLLNTVMNKLVRQLSGLGRLPDAPPDKIPEVTRRTVDVAVIGAGPAGLAAATAAASTGATTVVIDEQVGPGGCLMTDPAAGPIEANRRAQEARAAGAQLMMSSTAIGFFPEDEGGVLAVASPDGLTIFSARRYVYATGGYAVNMLFENNDRPGVVAARAVGRLLVQFGVSPSDRICVVGDDDYAARLRTALESAGCVVHAVDGTNVQVTRALGRGWVTGLELRDRTSAKQKKRKPKRRRIECEMVAVSATPSPASEALRQHGCAVELRPDAGGFAAVVDTDGRTSVANVFACGDVCGFVGADSAATSGASAGAVAAAEALEENGA